MEGEFFKIENLQRNCIRTLIRREQASGSVSGKIFSEGCYMMEIINYSRQLNMFVRINGQEILLQAGVLNISALVDPAQAQVYDYRSLILPGEPYLVRSDIIEYQWDQDVQELFDFAVIRHMVVPFQEGVSYPVYTGKK